MNNELLDAFPILKFIYKDGKWCEILVDNSAKSTDDNISFKYTISKPNNDNVVKYLQPEHTFQGLNIKEGETYELSPERI